MNKKQKISSHLFRAILNALTEEKVDIDHILKEATISKELFSNPDYRIDTNQVKLFWMSIDSKTQSNTIGLTLGSRIKVSELGLTGMFFMYSATIREALEKQIYYSKLFSDFLSIEVKKSSILDRERIEIHVQKNHPKPNYVIQCQITILTKTILEIAGKEHKPEKIYLDFNLAKDDLEKFTNHFNCPIIFDDKKNAIEYKSSTLDHKLLHRDPNILRHLEILANNNLKKLLQEDCFSNNISNLIKSNFYKSNHAISLSEIAKNLGVSGRTLQRKLRQESTNYSSILEAVRKEEAVSLLKQNKLNINEISWFLGYSEASSFVNQFKIWTGESPTSYK